MSLEIGANVTVGTDEITRLIKALPGMGRDAAREFNRALGGEVVKKISLEVDKSGAGRGLKAVEKEYLTVVDKIRQELKKLNSVEIGSTTSLRQAVNEAKKARDGIKKYEEAAGGLTVVNSRWEKQNEKVKELSNQLRKVDGSGFWDRLKGDLGVGQILSFSNGLSQVVNGFQAISIVVGQVIGSINGLTDALSKLQNFSLAFQAIGAGASGAQQALFESSRIALNLGVGLNTVREGFQQLSPVILNSGGSLSDVSGVMEALSSRFAAFGLSGDKARRVTNGIIQAFGKGKLMAEELTQQIAEADPAFGTDLARALGVSTAKLLEMVKAGEITTDVLLRALPALSKSSLLYGNLGVSANDAVNALTRSNSGIVVTFEQVRNKIASLNQLSLESLAESAKPFLVALLRLQAGVSDFFSTVSKSGALEALGAALGGVVDVFGAVLGVFLSAATGFLTVIEPVASFVAALLKLPGASQLVGAAILASLIAPLKALQASFLSTLRSGGLLLKTLAGSDGPVGAIASSIGGLNDKTKATASASSVAAAGYAKQAKGLATLSTAYVAAGKGAEQQKAKLDRLNSAKAAQDGRQGLLGPKIDAGIARAEKEYASLTKAQERAAQKFRDVSASATATGQALSQSGRLTKEQGAEYGRLTKSLGSLQTVNRQATTSLAASKASLTSLATGLKAGTVGLDEYRTRSAGLVQQIERLGNIQDSTNARIAGLKDRLGGLASQAEKPIGAIGRLGQGFKGLQGVLATTASGAKTALAGIGAALGPLGIALALVGVLQAAYATATAKSTEATEKAAITTQAFKDILKGLADVELETPDPEGFELAWKAFAVTAAEELNAAGKGVDAFISATQGDFKKLEGINPLGFFQRQLDALQNSSNGKGLVAIKQFALDAEGQLAATATGVKNLQEALVKLKEIQVKPLKQGETKESKEAATFTAFNKTQEQASLLAKSLTDLEARQAAVNKRYVEGGKVSKPLQDQLQAINIKIKEGRAELTTAQKDLINFGVAIGALSDKQIVGAVSTLGALGDAAKGAKESLNDAIPNSDQFAKFAAASAATEAAIERLKKKAEDPIVLKTGVDTALAESSIKIAEAQSRLTKAQSEGDVLEIARVRTELAALNRDRENLKEFKIELDASSINNAQKAIKSLEEKILKINVYSPELPALIANLQAAKEILLDREFVNRQVTIDIIAIGLEDGSLVASANKFKELTDLIDNQIASVSIDSPELPGLIQRLEYLREEVDALDNKKATITVEVIQKGLSNGSIPRTQNALDAQASAQQRVVNTTPSTSPNYDAELQKFKQFEEQKKAIAMSTEQLRDQLTTNNLQRAVAASDQKLAVEQALSARIISNIESQKAASEQYFTREKERIKSTAEAVNESYERRKAAIQAEIALVSKRYDAEISKLQQLTPAEQKLENQRIAELQRKAQQGGQEGLEAQAQLERIDREKQIASIRERKQKAEEEAQRKQAKLEKEQAAAAKAAAAEAAALEKQEQAAKLKFEQELQAEKTRIQAIEAENEKVKLQLQKQQQKQEEENRKAQDEAIKKELEARKGLNKDAKELSDKILDASGAIRKEMLPAFGEAAVKAKETSDHMTAASKTITDSLLPAMTNAAAQAKVVASQINQLDGRIITVYVRQVPLNQGKWTGGPVTGGQSYTVNELGREGFMSSTGSIQEIKRPAYGTWRAPSSGYVIPAHIWSDLDAPKAGVKVSQPVSRIGTRDSGAKMLNILKTALSGGGDYGVRESVDRLSEMQARQAAKIGRLSHAISKLADKDWNVSVHVPPSGPQGHLNGRRRGLS